MKRTVIVLLLLLALVLSACSGTETVPQTVYTVEKDGMTFTVDTENRTISHGDDVFQYRSSEQTNGMVYTIIYPDGAEYSLVCEEYVRYGGGNDLYYENNHSSGETLIDVLCENQPDQKPTWKSSGDGFLWGLLFIILGIVDLVFPYAEWFSSHGWWYKDAEPSDIALNLIRIGGVLLIILGIILLFL